MSPSSSGSWSGARGADIIDLDRYMRGAVRPISRHPPAIDDQTDCDLVVDAGAGVGGVKARHKRFSHDSGVSDSSYSRQRRARHARPHRRISADCGVEPTSTRALDSTDSLRAFRAVCEQALLEQQRQIARVAQLCERLTERAEKDERSEQKDVPSPSKEKDRRSCDERAKSDKAKSSVERSVRQIERAKPASTADVSELSSSTSRSTKDPIQKDRHRTQQCKTYKLIMSKLDELNRLFSSRSPPGPRPRPRPRAPSSSSVTVCDKLVATEPVMVDNSNPHSARPCSLGSRRVTRAYCVDIAPPQRPPNVVTESVVKCESDKGETSSSGAGAGGGGGDPRCPFDLEDPVHLYSQAKKLQTLTAATTPRGRHPQRERGHSAGSPRGEQPSLCAACRDYWRSLRHCLLPHLLSQPGHCKC